MASDEKKTEIESKVSGEGESPRREQEAKPVDIESLIGEGKEKKKGVGKKLLGLLFPMEKSAPRAQPAHFKDKSRTLIAIVAACIVGFILLIYLLSTPNKDIEQQKQPGTQDGKVAQSPPPTIPEQPVERQLAPITESRLGAASDDEDSRKGAGRVVTPDEVLQTADPKSAAVSPQQQLEFWRKQAALWKERAEGQKQSPGDTEPGRSGKSGLKPDDEFEKDVQQFLAEKERNQPIAGEGKGYDLAQIQPDFSKVPNLDDPNFYKPAGAPSQSGGPRSGQTPDPGKGSDKDDRSSSAPNAASTDPKTNPLEAKSLVFLREEKKAPPAGNANPRHSEAPIKSIPLTTKLKARLQSTVSTAVDLPAVAVIEHNYVRDGEVLIPAGSKAFGKLTQANRNGMVTLAFESLLTPDNKTIKLNGLAQGLNGSGPLRGEVSGKNTGKRLLARTFGTIGGIGALVAGHPGGLATARPYSYGDYLRGQLAYGITGEAGRALSNLDREDIQVTVPANTRFEIVLMSAVKITDTDE